MKVGKIFKFLAEFTYYQGMVQNDVAMSVWSPRNLDAELFAQIIDFRVGQEHLKLQAELQKYNNEPQAVKDVIQRNHAQMTSQWQILAKALREGKARLTLVEEHEVFLP